MTFRAPASARAALIPLRAAFENLSLIFVRPPAVSDIVERLASSAWERTLAELERPAPLAPFSFARSCTVAALSTVSVTAALASLCFLVALSFWRGLDCGSTRKAPRMKGWIRQKYV